jgi:uroporphyrinogen decarboxylase
MITSRERMLKAFNFANPDKIPVYYHPSPAGMFIQGQKMIDLFNAYPPDNAIVFDKVPVAPEGTLNSKGVYHEIKVDEWGTKREHMIYGIHGMPLEYPVANWKEALDMKFPPHIVPDAKDIAEKKKNYLTFDGWISIFEKLSGLRPMDEVLIDLLTGDQDLLMLLEKMRDYWLENINQMIDAGIDVIIFGDDWGTQSATLVAPELFRDIFKPLYRSLFEPIKKNNRKVFLHCCGYMGEIFDEFVELGIDGLWPQIKLFESDPKYMRVCRENKITIYIHADRQYLIPLGTPKEIRSEIKRYADIYRKQGGGGILYVEIENDAPFENVVALVKAIDEFR